MKNRRDDIVPPQAKVSANYTSPMQAKWNARRAGYDEILLVDEDGYVAEGPTTNVFMVDDARARSLTPPERPRPARCHAAARSSRWRADEGLVVVGAEHDQPGRTRRRRTRSS